MNLVFSEEMNEELKRTTKYYTELLAKYKKLQAKHASLLQENKNLHTRLLKILDKILGIEQ